MNRPQNRHLRPWTKGGPNPPPRSLGRPRTARLFEEFGEYLAANEDTVNEYLSQRVGGKMRFHLLIDVLSKRRPDLIFYALVGRPR